MHELLQDNTALEKKVAGDPNYNPHTKPSKKWEHTEDVQGLLSCSSVSTSFPRYWPPNTPRHSQPISPRLCLKHDGSVFEAGFSMTSSSTNTSQRIQKLLLGDRWTVTCMPSSFWVVRGNTLTCVNCMSSDHTTEQCALAFKEESRLPCKEEAPHPAPVKCKTWCQIRPAKTC